MTGLHVQEAMNKIKLELARHGGITKDRTAPVGGGYAFRGIDDIYNVLCGLTAQHGVNMYPSVVGEPKIEYQVTSKMGRGGERIEQLQTHVHLLLDVKIVSAVDGSSETMRTAGEAIDHGDKATNKAMSAAMKYACIMGFQIPVHGENVDIEAHDVQVAPAVQLRPPVAAAIEEAVQQAAEAPARKKRQPKEDKPLPKGDLLPVHKDPLPEEILPTSVAESEAVAADEDAASEQLDPGLFDKFAAKPEEGTDWQMILRARVDKTTSFVELFEVAEEADPRPEPARTTVFDHVFARSKELIGAATTVETLKESKALIKALGSPVQLLEAYNAKYATFRGAK